MRQGARLEANSFNVQRNWGVGILVAHGATVLLENGFVGETTAILTRPSDQIGYNAVAVEGGHLRMHNFTCTRADLSGVLIARRGEVDLSGDTPPPASRPGFLSASQVSHNPVGVSLHVPGYDISRLTDQVLYTGNGTNCEPVDHAVPEAGDPGGL